MRNLFIIGVILLGAFMAGWFKVNRDGDRTTIEINRGEIRQDARKAIDRGRELLQEHEAQSGGVGALKEQAVELWNQGIAAPPTGNWGGEVGQAGYQSYGPTQSIGQQTNGGQPMQQVVPANNWQFQTSPQPTPYQ